MVLVVVKGCDMRGGGGNQLGSVRDKTQNSGISFSTVVTEAAYCSRSLNSAYEDH